MTNVSYTLRRLVARAVGGYFDGVYAEWADSAEATREVYKRLAAQVAVTVEVGKILDVGSGPGHLAIEIARLLPETKIVGLDLSASMVEVADKNVAEQGVSDRVVFRQGDAAEIPFVDCAFDFVVSSWSLHLWRDPARVFAEIYRVLKPGCGALVYDARKHPPAQEVRRWMSTADSLVMRLGLRHSFNEGYTAEEIEDIVRGVPFGQVKVQAEGADLEIRLKKQEV
ncbi:MAG: class I SAM-dependent methyltransferase [Anaerolineae bacterium]|nr:class I SAM-dependent methyltransferase [Anaerolineae bacterium]